MAKVEHDDGDVLFEGKWLAVRAMVLTDGSKPAKDWVQGLARKGQAQFLAACKAMENSLRSGRPPAGRANKISSSSEGLWELRVTKQGSTPPHLRLLYLRERKTLWAAYGFTKTSNKLKASDIRKGDSIAERWRDGTKGQ